MQLAVSLPREELGLDAARLRDFLQGVEALGYTQVHTGEHVLGADPTNRPGWSFPYTHQSFWHEPLTFMAFVAACTQRIELVSSILILPLRQTPLVAKQAAEVDGLSGGRLRLGIGLGSVPVEFEFMGQDYQRRARRVEEQIALLRELWTKPVVTFEGRWDRVVEAGINPLAVQRPIPIWMGGGTVEASLQRIARLADGWILSGRLEGGKETLDRFRSLVRAGGRNPDDIAISARTTAARGTPAEWRAAHAAWADLGATHLAVGTAGITSNDPAVHLDALRRFKEAVA